MLKTPNARFAARTIVVAVIGYLASALAQGGTDGITDWGALGWGAASAAAYAVIGLLTPTEPFVGVTSKTPVEVPADQSTPV